MLELLAKIRYLIPLPLYRVLGAVRARPWIIVALLAALSALLGSAHWRARFAQQAQIGLIRAQSAAERAALRWAANAALERAKTSERKAAALELQAKHLDAVSKTLADEVAHTKAEAARRQTLLATLPLAEVGKLVPMEFQTAPLTEAQTRELAKLKTDDDSCHQLLNLSESQNVNCQEQSRNFQQMLDELKSETRELRTTISFKDQEIARQQTLAKAELKVARGSWWQRFTGKAKWAAVALGVGFAAGVAAR